jgi:hypothetical protein
MQTIKTRLVPFASVIAVGAFAVTAGWFRG